MTAVLLFLSTLHGGFRSKTAITKPLQKRCGNKLLRKCYNYNTPITAFEVKQQDNELIIITDKCKLIYSQGNGELIDRIHVEFQKNNASVLSAINEKDTRNLGGVIKSVDRCDGRLEYKEYNTNSEATPLKMPNGLLSEQGFTVLKIVGIIIALVAVYLTSVKEEKITHKNAGLLFPILLFLGSGAIDTTLKYVEVSFVPKDDVSIFSGSLFGIAAFFGLIILLIKAIKNIIIKDHINRFQFLI